MADVAVAQQKSILLALLWEVREALPMLITDTIPVPYNYGPKPPTNSNTFGGAVLPPFSRDALAVACFLHEIEGDIDAKAWGRLLAHFERKFEKTIKGVLDEPPF